MFNIYQHKINNCMETITVKRIKHLIEQEKETPNSFAKKIGVTANAVYNKNLKQQQRLTG